MNDMRKLMEAVEDISAVDLLDEYHGKVINEGWDVKGIAGIIYNEMSDEFSPVGKVAEESPEPFRAAIYEFGNRSGLYNPETLDGSEIYHQLVDELERLGQGPGYDDDEPLTGESIEEGASPEQWEIAINNLIAEGDTLWDADTLVDEQRRVWRWVRNELHGMLDFQPEGESLGEEFPAQGSEQECAWWAGCTNDATTTEPHPVLGDVPICDRCVAKIRKIEGLD